MRLIDAEALASDLMERWNTADEQAEKQIIPVLANIVTPILVGQPTVDAVEVVRCRDCKHRHLDGMIWNCPFGLSGGEDFFCAYGAKDGEADDKKR